MSIRDKSTTRNRCNKGTNGALENHQVPIVAARCCHHIHLGECCLYFICKNWNTKTHAEFEQFNTCYQNAAISSGHGSMVAEWLYLAGIMALMHLYVTTDRPTDRPSGPRAVPHTWPRDVVVSMIVIETYQVKRVLFDAVQFSGVITSTIYWLQLAHFEYVIRWKYSPECTTQTPLPSLSS